MIRILSLRHSSGSVLWSRMGGTCGIGECHRLLALLAATDLTPGSRVVLDFGEVDHLHYRAVPLLLEIGAACRARSVTLRIIGLSDYLVQILEVAGDLASRDFLEEHEGIHTPAAEPANATFGNEGTFRPLTAWPRGFVVVCPN